MTIKYSTHLVEQQAKAAFFCAGVQCKKSMNRRETGVSSIAKVQSKRHSVEVPGQWGLHTTLLVHYPGKGVIMRAVDDVIYSTEI